MPLLSSLGSTDNLIFFFPGFGPSVSKTEHCTRDPTVKNFASPGKLGVSCDKKRQSFPVHDILHLQNSKQMMSFLVQTRYKIKKSLEKISLKKFNVMFFTIKFTHMQSVLFTKHSISQFKNSTFYSHTSYCECRLHNKTLPVSKGQVQIFIMMCAWDICDLQESDQCPIISLFSSLLRSHSILLTDCHTLCMTEFQELSIRSLNNPKLIFFSIFITCLFDIEEI